MVCNQNTPFSIIIPTYQEAKNIPELTHLISKVDFGPRKFEVILVDDNSQDGTKEVVEALVKQFPWLRLIVRLGQKGLSEAVLEGFAKAKYPLYVIMDADLSHPPAKIPEMLAYLSMPTVDLVIGSRYVKGGGSDESWPINRKIFSRLATLFAKILIASPVKDPLSGFLALKKSTYLSANKLEPIGWKIGLEIMVKCHCKNIQEVPIYFTDRNQGVSKLNFKVALNYIKHITRLLRYKLSMKRINHSKD